VKTASVRDFRARLAEWLEGSEPVLIRRHGKNVAVVYPLRDPGKVPMEVRRTIVNAMARQFEVPEVGPMHPHLIESYKRDVDRTLIRENLRRTPEERLRALQEMQRFAAEARRAGSHRP
jgi:antitoxin (DNA-binding transcriptional repressor) of toxin-antitoxin stability system